MAVLLAVALAFNVPLLNAAEPDILYWPDGDGTAENDSYFGRTIDFDGELMVIGAPGAGAAYVFQLADAGWQHAATLATPTVEPWNSEMQLAVDGGFVAVGVPSSSVDGIEQAGLVYVFAQGETAAQWQEVARLTADNPVVEGWFGDEVEFEDGRILVAGRSQNDPAGYLFERNGSGEWVLARKFAGADGSGLVADDIAIDGDRIAFVRREVAAYIYEHSESGWVLADVLPIGSAHTVALEGDVLVVGSPYESIFDETPRIEGVAYLFERADGEWQQVARLHSPGEDPLGYFGTRMDMQDGLLVVGEGHETGAVYAFRKNEEGDWSTFAGTYHGSLHGTVHVPAISARAMAIGYSVFDYANVELFDVAELMNEASDTDETDDDAAGDDDPGSDDPDDGAGDDVSGDDGSGSDGDGSADTGSDDSNGTATGGDSGDAGGGTDLASGSGSTGAESEPDETGGGAMAWLVILLGLLRKPDREREGGRSVREQEKLGATPSKEKRIWC